MIYLPFNSVQYTVSVFAIWYDFRECHKLPKIAVGLYLKEWILPTALPFLLSKPASRKYGSSVPRINPWILKITCNNVEVRGFQISVPSPSHVPKRLKQISPSGYKLGLNWTPFTQWKKNLGGRRG